VFSEPLSECAEPSVTKDNYLQIKKKKGGIFSKPKSVLLSFIDFEKREQFAVEFSHNRGLSIDAIRNHVADKVIKK